jgi:transcriptional regulator with XRE-family HTH domain
MAAAGLSVCHAAARTGLDERTIRAILAGNHKPHTQTLHRLAEGLGVPIDEFFVDPARLLYRRLDQHANPLVANVMDAHQELFEGWTEADFEELHSRVGTGGALTAEGALTAVRQMNQKRQLHEKLDLLLESSHADVIAGILDVLYERIGARA